MSQENKEQIYYREMQNLLIQHMIGIESIVINKFFELVDKEIWVLLKNHHYEDIFINNKSIEEIKNLKFFKFSTQIKNTAKIKLTPNEIQTLFKNPKYEIAIKRMILESIHGVDYYCLDGSKIKEKEYLKNMASLYNVKEDIVDYIKDNHKDILNLIYQFKEDLQPNDPNPIYKHHHILFPYILIATNDVESTHKDFVKLEEIKNDMVDYYSKNFLNLQNAIDNVGFKYIDKLIEKLFNEYEYEDKIKLLKYLEFKLYEEEEKNLMKKFINEKTNECLCFIENFAQNSIKLIKNTDEQKIQIKLAITLEQLEEILGIPQPLINTIVYSKTLDLIINGENELSLISLNIQKKKIEIKVVTTEKNLEIFKKANMEKTENEIRQLFLLRVFRAQLINCLKNNIVTDICANEPNAFETILKEEREKYLQDNLLDKQIQKRPKL